MHNITLNCLTDKLLLMSHAEVDQGGQQDVQRLLASNSAICVNPVYLSMCNVDERAMLESAGLLGNNSLLQNQASADVVCSNICESNLKHLHNTPLHTPLHAPHVSMLIPPSSCLMPDALPLATAHCTHIPPEPKEDSSHSRHSGHSQNQPA